MLGQGLAAHLEPRLDQGSAKHPTAPGRHELCTASLENGAKTLCFKGGRGLLELTRERKCGSSLHHRYLGSSLFKHMCHTGAGGLLAKCMCLRASRKQGHARYCPHPSRGC